MNPRPDTRVHDRVVLDEIELYGELIIAASASDGPLSEDEIDEVLGVRHDCGDAAAGQPPGASRPTAMHGPRACSVQRSRSAS